MNVILTGYRGTGKTSVGRAVAALLQMPFRDTDEMVQGRTGKTVRDIVRTGGWTCFRNEEKAVILAIAPQDGNVISLGGGALMDPDNIDALKRNGFIIWLKADKETMIERLLSDGISAAQRPALSGRVDLREEMEQLLEQRLSVYRSLADADVDTTGRGIDEIAAEICTIIRNRKEKIRRSSCREIP